MSVEMVIAVIVVSAIAAWVVSSIIVRVDAWIWARNLPAVREGRADDKRFKREMKAIERNASR